MAVFGGAAPLVAQRIVVPSPVQAGVPFQAVVEVGPQGGILSRPPLFLLRPGSGELIGPTMVDAYPVGESLPPGRQIAFTFTAPAIGAGSQGSLLLLADLGNNVSGGQVVGQLDVGAATVVSRTHLFPTYIAGDDLGRIIRNEAILSLANSDAVARTIANGQAQLFAAGVATPIATLSLAGLTVDKYSARRVAFDTRALADGAYVVRAAWTDPVTGIPVQATHGLLKSVSAPAVALDFPDGKVLRPGATRVEARAVGVYFSSAGMPAMSYAFVLALQPGSTPFAGSLVPFVADDLVLASLQNGVGGVLANHVGAATWTSVRRGHGLRDLLGVGGISVGHPNLARIRNLRVRGALVLFGSGGFGASQAEELVFQ
ncbi:MAG: hypothetical protein R3F56_25950 [Planctomycetota bacterium]